MLYEVITDGLAQRFGNHGPGFLVLGLEKYLGRAVLVPMVTLYAFWHFGKPVPEAIRNNFV